MSYHMKLMVKHKLPKRLRYAQVYLELFTASLYFSLDGAKASIVGSIGGNQKRPIAVVSDREYSAYRAARGIIEVLDEDADKVVLRTTDGYEEEWIRPKWVLNGVRRTTTTRKSN